MTSAVLLLVSIDCNQINILFVAIIFLSIIINQSRWFVSLRMVRLRFSRGETNKKQHLISKLINFNKFFFSVLVSFVFIFLFPRQLANPDQQQSQEQRYWNFWNKGRILYCVMGRENDSKSKSVTIVSTYFTMSLILEQRDRLNRMK